MSALFEISERSKPLLSPSPIVPLISTSSLFSKMLIVLKLTENFTLSSVEFNASETKITYGDLFVKEKGTTFTITTDSEVGKTAVNFKTISLLPRAQPGQHSR